MGGAVCFEDGVATGSALGRPSEDILSLCIFKTTYAPAYTLPQGL